MLQVQHHLRILYRREVNGNSLRAELSKFCRTMSAIIGGISWGSKRLFVNLLKIKYVESRTNFTALKNSNFGYTYII